MDRSTPYTAGPWASTWARASVSHLACMRVGAGHLTGPRVQHTCCSPFWLPPLTFLAAICWSGPRWQRPKREAGPQCPPCSRTVVRAQADGQKNPQEAPTWRWADGRPLLPGGPPHTLHIREVLDKEGLCKHWSAGPGACSPTPSSPGTVGVLPRFLLPLAETW